jgi:hypothetical protein
VNFAFLLSTCILQIGSVSVDKIEFLQSMNTPHFIPIFIIIEDFDKSLIFKTFEPGGLISIALSNVFVNHRIQLRIWMYFLLIQSLQNLSFFRISSVCCFFFSSLNVGRIRHIFAGFLLSIMYIDFYYIFTLGYIYLFFLLILSFLLR